MTVVADTPRKMRPLSMPLAWGLAAVAVLAIAHYHTFETLVARWIAMPEFSHGFFIPLISLWLVWERRDVLGRIPLAPSYVGLAIVVAGSVVLALGDITDTAPINHISLIITLVGLVWAAGGWRLTRILAVPLFFLVFMVPWPYIVTAAITAKLQLISSQIGVEFIRYCNIPVFLEGNVIDLGNYRLGVVEACSGLSYLVPLLGLGFMAAYFCRGPLWHKAVVLAAIVPLTIVMNSFRIAMTGVISQYVGIEYAEGFLHYFEGWAVFVMCIGVIYLIMVALAILSRMPGPFSPMHLPSFEAREPRAASPTAGWSPMPFILSLAVLLATTAVVAAATARIETPPSRAQLIGLPYDIAPTDVQIQPLSKAVEDTLAADDYIVADINRATPDPANLYVAYLKSQRDDRSWHSPRQCIPGGGWQIASHTIREAPTDDGAIELNRLIIEKNGVQQLVYYWYQQRGRTMASEWTVKYYLVRDSILMGRTDGAMVRLTTLVRPGETPDDADRRLIGYVARVKAALPKYVPD